MTQTSFIHLDIQNFFGSINRTRITRCLKNLFGYDRAREIANASTVSHPETKNHILPFGFIQSPIIASICLRESALGRYLEELHRMKGVTVSVYVDDLIISTKDESISKAILDKVSAKATRANFTLNAKKQEGPSAHITAFNILLSENSLSIEESRLNKFIDAYLATDSVNKQRGILGYINSINSDQGLLISTASR